MIKVDAIGDKMTAVEFKGSHENISTELILIIASLLKNDLLEDKDKRAIINLLRCDKETVEHFVRELRIY